MRWVLGTGVAIGVTLALWGLFRPETPEEIAAENLRVGRSLKNAQRSTRPAGPIHSIRGVAQRNAPSLPNP